MSQDQSYPRRNKVDWHMASDDPILTTMRFTPQHEVVQKYGAILLNNITTQAMKESKAYKTYYAFATGKEITKPKYVRRPTKEKNEQAPKASSGKRIKATAKVARSGKKKQSAKGLKTLSEIAFSQPNGLGTHKGIGVKPGVLDVPTYKFDDEQISWKSNDEEDDDDVVMSDDADDNDDQNDDNAYNEKRQDGEDKEEEWFDDDKNQGTNVEGEELDEEETNEEDKANELYRDVNVNLEGRDTEMTDAPHTIAQTTQVIEDTH
ncbi:hypothetical protein Tco_0025370, partial [Tanacetum coccineum]